ncbi:competence type IV pilus minor pilin ComGD [Bacillus sp. B190/17]|uniref:Competence type IV pilus minor pilin ComGD n=1 Tax=Bacillus lumedeiriae TaxID=3058829 RepID=A0ABW8I4G3_9BACI
MLNKLAVSIKKEKGFTIIETIIVLMVILVLLSAAVLPFPKLAANFEKEKFLNQLQADLFLAQSYAAAKQEVVEVRFIRANNCYVIRSAALFSDMAIQRELPDTMQYAESSLANLSFLPNGNTTSFGTVRFKYRDRLISVVFQIGKGRFYVKEE